MANVMTKYATEVASAVRTNKAFSVTACFQKADGYRNEKPLGFYGGFSRIPITLIDKTKHCQITGNIGIDEIPFISKNTAYAYNKHMESMLTPVKSISVPNNPAYTTKFVAGNLKGRCPADVLLHESDGMALLEQQYNFLKKNVEKFPQNKVLMNAIVQAVNLYKEGKIEETDDATTSLGEVLIYSADMRPNIHKKRDDGKCPCYEIKIIWHLGDDAPVEVAMCDYYAPVIEKEDGRLNLLKGEKDPSTFRASNMRLSIKEWLHILASIERAMRTFEDIVAISQFKQSFEINEINRKNNAKLTVAN